MNNDVYDNPQVTGALGQLAATPSSGSITGLRVLNPGTPARQGWIGGAEDGYYGDIPGTSPTYTDSNGHTYSSEKDASGNTVLSFIDGAGFRSANGADSGYRDPLTFSLSADGKSAAPVGERKYNATAAERSDVNSQYYDPDFHGAPASQAAYNPALAKSNLETLRTQYHIEQNPDGSYFFTGRPELGTVDGGGVANSVAAQIAERNRPSTSDRWIDGTLKYAPYLMVAGAGIQAGLASAGAGAESGTSGMDLAADGGANSVTNAGTQIGNSGSGGMGGSGYGDTWTGGEGPGGGEIANTGSDAHFYQPQDGGTGVQNLGNMGGPGSATVPSMGLSPGTTAGGGAAAPGAGGAGNVVGGGFEPSLEGAGEWLGGLTGADVLSGAGTVIRGAQAVAPIVGLVAGASGGGGGGTPAPGALNAMSAQDMGGASRYSYGGFEATPQAARPGHTRGPSNAVNMNDPSAAMFGYGKTPTYYSRPPDSAVPARVDPAQGLAEGGSVDPLGLDPLSVDAPIDYPERGYEFGPPPSTANPEPPKKDEGPMGWITRLLDGDRKAGMQMQMGVGGLGLLAALLSKRNKAGPGFQSVSQLRAGLGTNGNGAMTPQQLATMQQYFAQPAARYNPGAAPVTVGRGGLSSYAEGGEVFEPGTHGPYVTGEGSGQADGVDARLSPGEYVFDADVVAALGDGSNEHGAKMLDEMRQRIREHKRSAPAGEIPPAAKSPLEYFMGNE